MNALRESAERLPGHWIKGETDNGKGSYCGLGMLYEVVEHDSDQYVKFADMLVETAKEYFPGRVGIFESFIQFNDHPDTTEADVVLVFEKAAVRLDEQL